MTSTDRTWASPGSPSPTRSPRELACRLLGEIDTLDFAIYDVLAHTPTPTLDVPMTWISNAANYSRISIAIASALAVAGGKRGRLAAVRGLAAVGASSLSADFVAKHLFPRSRPDRQTGVAGRQARMPKSSSFPSGHTASAFAFAYAVAADVPQLSLPLFARDRRRLQPDPRWSSLPSRCRRRWTPRTSRGIWFATGLPSSRPEEGEIRTTSRKLSPSRPASAQKPWLNPRRKKRAWLGTPTALSRASATLRCLCARCHRGCLRICRSPISSAKSEGLTPCPIGAGIRGRAGVSAAGFVRPPFLWPPVPQLGHRILRRSTSGGGRRPAGCQCPCVSGG